MTEADEEKKFEIRLENWGRWLREGKHIGVSNLWPILQRLPKLKESVDGDQGESVDFDDAEPLPPVSEKDALKVQRAWNQLPSTSLADQEAKALIGATYAYRGCDMGRILFFVRQVRYVGSRTPIRIRPRDIDPHLERARTMLRNALKRIDEREKHAVD